MIVSDMHLWEWFKTKIAPIGASQPFRVLFDTKQVVPASVDLHGKTLQAAHAEVRNHLIEARAAEHKTTRVITGRSGDICREFPTWMALNENVKRIEATAAGGAFIVYLA